MRHWTIEVNERELRLILTAFDIARGEHRAASEFWKTSPYHVKLYERLVNHGLFESESA